MSIKTAVRFFKENWQTVTKTKEVAEISPSKIVFIPEKPETNTFTFLSKSAKKLDGEETRTILLNGHKVIPSNGHNIHTCYFEEDRFKGSGVTKASMLDHGVGLMLAVISQVEV